MWNDVVFQLVPLKVDLIHESEGMENDMKAFLFYGAVNFILWIMPELEDVSF